MLISRRESGFTLIEIMVVLVIIAIMTALIAPQIIGRVDEARVTAAKQDIRTLGTALDFYKMDNFRYPTTDQGLEALDRKAGRPDAAQLARRGLPESQQRSQGSLGQRLPLSPARQQGRRLRPVFPRRGRRNRRRRRRCRYRQLESRVTA